MCLLPNSFSTNASTFYKTTVPTEVSKGTLTYNSSSIYSGWFQTPSLLASRTPVLRHYLEPHLLWLCWSCYNIWTVPVYLSYISRKHGWWIQQTIMCILYLAILQFILLCFCRKQFFINREKNYFQFILVQLSLN